MGTGHSKNSPDEQMRKKMEDGFDEEDDDDGIDGLGISPERERNINPRSKSNVSHHNGERFPNSSADGDEYFNQIYNKSSNKSMQSSLSVGGGSFGVRSAPPGPKKQKDAEVAVAIAELEETFKVLGTEVPVMTMPPKQIAPQPPIEQTRSKVITMGDGGKGEFDNHDEELDNGYSDSLSIGGEDVPLTPPSSQTGEVMSDESGVDSQSSESSPFQQQIPQYSRQLISRAGPGPGRNLEMRGIPPPGTSGGFSRSNMFSSCGSSMPPSSRGLLVSSHNINKNGRNSSNMLSKSVLLQQRQDFQQRKLVTDQHNLRTEIIDENGVGGKTKVEDWTYEPPKIQGFDIEKFKEINSKAQTSTVLHPMILREDEDNGYCSRSPDIPAYTKDELAIIASLEREVF